mmetsp:Transcript_44808/g.111583  ORF Transcript_44808/g.111583 Transcript_44808/m.111583 type:complete len:94 (+) Transcript_44808:326-607(+)
MSMQLVRGHIQDSNRGVEKILFYISLVFLEADLWANAANFATPPFATTSCARGLSINSAVVKTVFGNELGMSDTLCSSHDGKMPFSEATNDHK